MLDLSGKNALITGATSRIGIEIAKALAKENVSLALLGRNLEKLNRIRQELDDTVNIHISQMDMTRDDQLYELPELIKKHIGTIDILVHNAGSISFGKVEDVPITELDREIRINFRGPYILTKIFLDQLKTNQGQIVFINSRIILNPRENFAGYTAMKFALKGLADTLRAELNQYGVRIVSIYPGKTATELQQILHAITDRNYNPAIMIQPIDIAFNIVNALKTPKSTEITDIYVRPMLKS